MIPDSVTSIDYGAFEGSGLGSIKMPPNLTSISDSMFYLCWSLTNVTIGTKVTTIGVSAFQYSGLNSVTLPASVTTIDNYAFDCGSDFSAYFEGNAPYEVGPNVGVGVFGSGAMAYYRPGTTGWTLFSLGCNVLIARMVAMQNSRSIRKHLPPQQREKIFQDHQGSGLTDKEFEQQAGVPVSTLHAWRRKAATHPRLNATPFVSVPNLLAAVPRQRQLFFLVPPKNSCR
jgi:hypothetical protein